MKRWIGSLALAIVAGTAMAQAPFTIVRPADSSKVREKVRILIPKDSIPPGGYVGIFLDGKLLEATVPPVQGKYHVYTLDTKGRGIPDTAPGQPIKLEMVLYVDFKDQPRIVDRTSVNINIANRSSIQVPSAGLTLRYQWKTGSELIYNLEQRQTTYQISEAANNLGGRPAQMPAEGERFRLRYAVDNSFGNGDGLVRLQAMPPKGKEYAELTAIGASSVQRYTPEEMAPVYMRLTKTGKQVWGSVAPFVPLESSAASAASGVDLYAPFPLPSLPEKAVRPGETWPSQFQRGNVNLAALYTADSFVSTFPAQGKFEGVEWEMGHPCAKLRNSIEVATTSIEAKKNKNAMFDGGDKVSLSEVIWFALDTRQILKVIRTQRVDTKTTSTFGSGSGFAGAGGFPGSGSYPGSMGSGGGLKGAGGGGEVDINTRGNMQVPAGFGQMGQNRGIGRSGMSGSGMSGMSFPGASGFPGSRSGSTTTSSTFTRVETQLIFTLQR